MYFTSLKFERAKLQYIKSSNCNLVDFAERRTHIDQEYCTHLRSPPVDRSKVLKYLNEADCWLKIEYDFVSRIPLLQITHIQCVFAGLIKDSPKKKNLIMTLTPPGQDMCICAINTHLMDHRFSATCKEELENLHGYLQQK